MIIIGAPFGNYVQWPGFVPTLGTFTIDYRGGFWKRVWRVLSTVRYYRGIQAWKNRLRLPNPGIKSLAESQLNLEDKIVSVLARNDEDWDRLLQVICNDLNEPKLIEMNLGCPNCNDNDYSLYDRVFRQWVHHDFNVIVKLPPIGFEKIVDEALDAGIKKFHACNTLPTPGGGLSGKILKPFTINCIKWIRKRIGHILNGIEIIAGGGINCKEDIREYADIGANHFAIASAIFNPFNWHRLRGLCECIPQ